MKITVVGAGYVGLSNAVLLAQHNDVWVLDVDAARVEAVNERRSPIVDPELEEHLRRPELSLRATRDAGAAYADACSTLGREVQVDLPAGEPIRGTALDVDSEGRLVVAGPTGETAVGAGDVVHVRPDSLT